MATDAQLIEVYNRRPDIQAMYNQYPEWVNKSPAERMRNWLSIAGQDKDAVMLRDSMEPTDRGGTDIATGGDQGSEVMGGIAWYQLALQAAQNAAQNALQWAQLNGQNALDARQLAMQEANAELQRWVQQQTLGLAGDQQAYEQLLQQQQLSGFMGVDPNSQPTLPYTQWYADTMGYLPGTQEATFARERWEAQQKASAASAARAAAERAAKEAEDKRRWELQYALSKAGQEGELGLGYANALNAVSGPRDWIKYWNTVRATQNTGLPQYLSALSQGLNMPAWQAPSTVPGGSYVPLPQGFGGRLAEGIENGTAGPGLAAQVAQALQGQGAFAGAAQGQPQQTAWGSTSNWNLPTILPHQITPQQWQGMLPSEQQGLLGLWEEQGANPEDMLAQMQRAFPTGGNQSAISYWQ